MPTATKEKPQAKESEAPQETPEALERPAHGQIGEFIFTEVKKRLEEGKAKDKQDAFEQIAGEMDMKAGTVAANYYRMARSHGETSPRGRRRRAKLEETDLEASLNDLIQSAEKVRRLVREQGIELQEYKRFKEFFTSQAA